MTILVVHYAFLHPMHVIACTSTILCIGSLCHRSYSMLSGHVCHLSLSASVPIWYDEHEKKRLFAGDRWESPLPVYLLRWARVILHHSMTVPHTAHALYVPTHHAPPDLTWSSKFIAGSLRWSLSIIWWVALFVLFHSSIQTAVVCQFAWTKRSKITVRWWGLESEF